MLNKFEQTICIEELLSVSHPPFSIKDFSCITIISRCLSFLRKICLYMLMLYRDMHIDGWWTLCIFGFLCSRAICLKLQVWTWYACIFRVLLWWRWKREIWAWWNKKKMGNITCKKRMLFHCNLQFCIYIKIINPLSNATHHWSLVITWRNENCFF